MDDRGLGAGYLQFAEGFPRPRVLRLPQGSFRTAVAMKADRQMLSRLLRLAALDESANALRLQVDLPDAASRVTHQHTTPHAGYTSGLAPKRCCAKSNGR